MRRTRSLHKRQASGLEPKSHRRSVVMGKEVDPADLREQILLRLREQGYSVSQDRIQLLTLAAEAIDERMARNAFADFASEPAAGARLPSTLRRMARIQGYFANQAILPFFDLPFAPFFLAVMFVIHPLIGLIGVSGAGLMLVLAVVAEATTRGMHDKASALDSDAFELALGLGDQRSAIVSMGLTGRALAAWQQKKALAKSVSLSGGRREIAFMSITRACRQVLQILVLGAGGALAISQTGDGLIQEVGATSAQGALPSGHQSDRGWPDSSWRPSIGGGTNAKHGTRKTRNMAAQPELTGM